MLRLSRQENEHIFGERQTVAGFLPSGPGLDIFAPCTKEKNLMSLKISVKKGPVKSHTKTYIHIMNVTTSLDTFP